jgi:hypothetical protein
MFGRCLIHFLSFVRTGENNVNTLLAYTAMKETRFVVTVNRVLNVILAFGLLVLWLAVLPDGTTFPPLRRTQITNFMKIIPNKIHPISNRRVQLKCDGTR